MKKLLFYSLLLITVTTIGLLLINPHTTVKASSGSTCFAPCFVPSVTLCAQGGTNPIPNGAFQSIESAENARAFYFIAHVTNCGIFVNDLAGSMLGGNPSGIESSTFGAWSSTDSTCTPANFIAPLWVARMGITSNSPAQYVDSPTGTNATLQGNTGVCVGFDLTHSDMYQGVNVVYGYF